jgi:hypothetical protein
MESPDRQDTIAAMIDPADIVELLDREPFEPFRVRMNDGNHYDVINPDLAVPMETKLFLALPKDRWKFLSYQNMTTIEDADVAA